MKPTGMFLSVIMTIVLPSVNAYAQDYSLKGRSALELNIGFWGGANVSNTITTSGIQSEAKANGFLGGIQYSRWIQEQLSATVSAGFSCWRSNFNCKFLRGKPAIEYHRTVPHRCELLFLQP